MGGRPLGFVPPNKPRRYAGPHDLEGTGLPNEKFLKLVGHTSKMLQGVKEGKPMDWTDHAEATERTPEWEIEAEENLANMAHRINFPSQAGDPFEELPVTAILRARARWQDPEPVILEVTPETDYRHPPVRVRRVKVPIKRVKVVSKFVLALDAAFLLASLASVVYNLVLYGWMGMWLWSAVLGTLVFFVLTLRQLRLTTKYVEKEVVEESQRRS